MPFEQLNVCPNASNMDMEQYKMNILKTVNQNNWNEWENMLLSML